MSTFSDMFSGSPLAVLQSFFGSTVTVRDIDANVEVQVTAIKGQEQQLGALDNKTEVMFTGIKRSAVGFDIAECDEIVDADGVTWTCMKPAETPHGTYNVQAWKNAENT